MGLAKLIFASRWLQLPLYIGARSLAQAIYVFHFWVELVHLIEAAFGNQNALDRPGQKHWLQDTVDPTALNETIIMLVCWP